MTKETQKIWSLYRITNLINQKVYIGQAADISKRWSDHRRAVKLNKPTQAIHFAIIKYGLDNFLFEIIATCKTQDGANETETLLVKQYDSFISKNKGYNATLGGNNAPKSDLWKQAIKKWRDSLSPEEKSEISRKQSEATIKQIETQGHPGLGSKRTDEQRSKMSTIQRSKDNEAIYTPEIRKRMSDAHIGIPQSEETIKKRVEAIKLSVKMRNELLTESGNLRCNAPECEIKGTSTYKIIDGIRYCFNHGQKLERSGTLESLPKHIQLNQSEEERKKCGQANIGRKPVNRINFTDDQIKIMCDVARSVKSLSREFSVTEKVIVRVRKENTLA